jgi:hypothetical protein
LRMVIVVAFWVAPAPKTSINVGSAISKSPNEDDLNYLSSVPRPATGTIILSPKPFDFGDSEIGTRGHRFEGGKFGG